ncbi:Uncharacterised protein [Halioglobus japonicus]|nr:Uncharacterised protein [Halioglobus japonicus]
MIYKMFTALALSFALTGCYSAFWQGVDRQMTTTPNGHVIGINCHNCYAEVEDVTETLSAIHEAQAAGADLIELDLIWRDGDVFVSHDPTTSPRTQFASVIADTALINGDQILFIELKTATTDTDFTNAVLHELMLNGYLGSGGRPVVIRSFQESTLDAMRSTLLDTLYSSYSERVRLSLIYRETSFVSLQAWQNDIIEKSSKYHMVEFDKDTENLFSLISTAKNQELGVGLWTFTAFTEVWAAAYRNEIDAIVIEGSGSKSRVENLVLAKQAAEANSSLIYTNLDRQNEENYPLIWFFNAGDISFRDPATPNFPQYEWLGETGEDRYGGSFVFRKDLEEYVRLQDEDNDTLGGFFVSTVVNFDDLSVGASETQAIISKADGGGFALELKGNKLRFGVHVGGAYHYAYYSTANLNTTDSYHVIGAYDGDGAVRMWVNGAHNKGPTIQGGVTQNDSSIVIGADPQGNSDQRFYFAGKVQLVNVQKWNGF